LQSLRICPLRRLNKAAKVQLRPKLGRWASELDGLLAANAAKPAREQLTLIRIFEELRGRGYDGGYDAVRRYPKRWQRRRAIDCGGLCPAELCPGEAYEFDWSHEVVFPYEPVWRSMSFRAKRSSFWTDKQIRKTLSVESSMSEAEVQNPRIAIVETSLL
jgi:hypothetical protein